MVVDMLVHTPGPTGVEVGRKGLQVGCDDHPIPCSSHPSHLFEARTRPFKPLQDDHQPIATSDGDDKTAGRCPISSFGSIFLTPQSRRRTRGGGALGGIDSATITTARASGVRSGAALPPPSDDGVMAPPRSLCVFSFLRVYIISTFVARVYTAHRFVSLSTPTMKFATLIILACLCVTAKSLGEDKSSNKATTAAELTQAHDPKINDDAIVNADEQAEADWGLKGSVRKAMVCTPLWYINCDGVCVMSCEVDIGGSCGGLAMPWVPLFDKKLVCCEKKLTSIGVPVYEQQLFRDSCLASCHSPTPAPANTSSKNPSTNPSSNPSEITINVSINECPCKDLKRIPDRCEVDILIDMLESHVLADRKLASQWTRAAFHDAGTFDVGIPEGGANGCLLNHPPMRYVDIDQIDLYLDSPLTHAFNTILQAASRRRIVF